MPTQKQQRALTQSAHLGVDQVTTLLGASYLNHLRSDLVNAKPFLHSGMRAFPFADPPRLTRFTTILTPSRDRGSHCTSLMHMLARSFFGHPQT